MDQKLLESLNNLSFALQEISDALKSKSEAQSATAKALQGGDFIKEIKEINVGVKQLQKDTKEILKNQQTIMLMAKSKSDSKENVAENLGKDKTSQKNFKEGIGVILLIAVAVLAIGTAFNLVGKVNFLAVIALSIALPLLAIAFAKVHTTLKTVGFDPKKDAVNFIIAVTSIALGLTMASWILSMISPLTFSKFFTTTFIALTFAMLGPSIYKFMMAFKDMSWTQLIKSVIAFPLILPSIALGIAFASWAFQLIKPIGFSQFLTAVGIAAVFAVVSFGIRKILKSFQGLDPVSLVFAALFLPIILPAIALGISKSSEYLQTIKPVSFSQLFTAIGIAAVFAVIGFGMRKLLKSFDGLSPGDAILAAFLVPLLLVAISWSISKSSSILSKTTDISFALLFKILAIGGVLSLLGIILTPTFRLLGKMSLSDLLKGSLAIVLVATSVMISSHILSLGNYSKYPDWKWALGVGLSLIAFTPAIAFLGVIAMSGVGALAILAGSAMVLVVAGTIVATSHILAKGNYANYPPLSWSASVALSMGAFALGMTTLGALIVASFGLGSVALAAGSAAVLMVADTIVETSFRLQKGKYTGGPTKDWAEGISLALGAFSPVYGMLMKNKIMSLFGGGVGPEDFTQAIKTVSQGIIDAANFFADPKNKGVWKGGPTKEWAEGIGTAIGAFAPVYKVLADNSGWLASGVSVEDMAKAIITISQGIVNAAEFFNSPENNGVFDISRVPSKEWAEGVGGALAAFSPVFDALNKKGFLQSGKNVIKNMRSAIEQISWGIVNSSRILTMGKFGTKIDPNFVEKLSKNVVDYMALVQKLNEYQTSSFKSTLGLDPVQNIATGMVKIANAYDKLAKAIRGFSSALNGLDPIRVSSFTRLTGNIAMLSAMDSNMFSNMLKVLESRAGVFSKLIDIQEKKEMATMPIVKTATGGGQSVRKGEESVGMKDAKGETQLQKLDKIVAILTLMNENVMTIDQFLQSSGAKNSDIGKGDG